MDHSKKTILISGAVLLTYLLYKFGFKGYKITETQWNQLNKSNQIVLPIKGDLKLTSGFGWRSFGGGQFHNGIDLVLKNKSVLGEPLFAPLSGEITANYFNDRGGNQLVLDSGFAKFGFAHLQNKSPLPVGSKVKKGQLIGYVGNTGTSTGAHLHFTLRLNNKIVDPIANITKLKNAIA
jgi:murein DD-endopeptidase MepM/ murein hydrolase activator NlpD